MRRRSRWRTRRRSFKRQLGAREVALIGFGGHLDLIAGDGASVRDRRAVEGYGEGELVAVNLAIVYGYGIALRACNGSGELRAVLLKDESERETVVAVGGLHLTGPGAGHVRCGED